MSYSMNCNIVLIVFLYILFLAINNGNIF